MQEKQLNRGSVMKTAHHLVTSHKLGHNLEGSLTARSGSRVPIVANQVSRQSRVCVPAELFPIANQRRC